jgi:hypothetical protein
MILWECAVSGPGEHLDHDVSYHDVVNVAADKRFLRYRFDEREVDTIRI